MPSRRVERRPDNEFMRSYVVISLILGTLAIAPARAAVEFAGYVTAQGETKFVLRDTETGQTSPWLGRGGSASGYTVIGFDAKREMLTVERAGTVTQLPLKAAQVQAALELTSVAIAPVVRGANSKEDVAEAKRQLTERLAKLKALQAERLAALDRRKELKQAEADQIAKDLAVRPPSAANSSTPVSVDKPAAGTSAPTSAEPATR